MTADPTPGHGGNGGLCTEDHFCGCESGGACTDLFEHPTCGVVACCADEVAAAEHHPECYQCTGVPADMPADICDCRVLRMLDAAKSDVEVTDAKPAALVVHIDPPDPMRNVHPCELGVHAWAWAYLAGGGTAQRCYACGVSR